MQMKLAQGNPEKDGYYLVRFGEIGGLHLVLIQTLLDGTRQIIPDVCPFLKNNKKVDCPSTGKPLRFNQFPTHAYWSEPLEIV